MGEEQINRSFYSIIPAPVMTSKDIAAGAKLLYAEISALCNYKGFCWAENKYFSDFFGKSERTITRWINDLKESGFIFVNYHFFEGKNGIEKRCISIVEFDYFGEEGNDYKTTGGGDKVVQNEDKNVYPLLDKNVYPPRQKCLGGLDKNVYPQPYYNNKTNIINNTMAFFDLFWVKYPNKKKKQMAFKKFEKICKDKKVFEAIMEGLEKHLKTKAWNKDDGQYIPHPTTWLNNRCWEDEIKGSELIETSESNFENGFDKFGNKIL